VFTIIFLWISLVVVESMAKKKSRNPIARILKFFTPKRFKDKTKYNRKQDDIIWKRSVGKSDES
jgi:hypothetical protein